MNPTRRRFLGAAAALGLAPRLGWAAAGGPAFLAAAGLADGRFALLGLSAAGAEVFRLPLPARGHAAAARPDRPEAVAFGRRPGRFALVLDCAAGRAAAELAAPEGRAFQGHGAFSADGRILFTTETAEAGRGVIGIWDAAAGYRRIGETASGGVGPHEALLMPDGARLAVANGGIATETDSRTALNLAEMRPNLAFLDAATGTVIETLEPPPRLRLNSLRHLAVGRDGTLAAALQWQGAEIEAPPLLALHRPGAAALEFRAGPAALQRRLRNYAGSVAVSADGTRAALSAPRGGLMAVFETGGPGVETVEAADLCGVAPAGGGFAFTTGEGRFGRTDGGAGSRAALAFDNHLVAIPAG
jgi:hypothetical protein